MPHHFKAGVPRRQILENPVQAAGEPLDAKRAQVNRLRGAPERERAGMPRVRADGVVPVHAQEAQSGNRRPEPELRLETVRGNLKGEAEVKIAPGLQRQRGTGMFRAGEQPFAGALVGCLLLLTLAQVAIFNRAMRLDRFVAGQ